MRVIVLGLRGIPNIQGGIEQHAEQLYPLLVRLGCQVEVICRSPYISRIHRSWNGLIIHRIWAPKVTGLEALLHSILGVIYAGIKRPDILHIHAVGPSIVAPLGRAFRLKVVVTHHGPDYNREKWGRLARWILSLGERWGMSFANQRIVISDVIRKLVYNKYKLDSIVIPNGVNLPVIPNTEEALKVFSLISGRYILMVSRIVPEKRHLDLIEAYARSGLNGWKLALVGEVDRRDDYCKRVLLAASNTPGVVITDYQTGKALQELYAHAGIFVLPSSHEGLPIALLEALSYGLPVLASDIPANKEIGLQEKHYFQLGNIQSLADALLHLSVGQCSKEQRLYRQLWVSKRYDWAQIAERTLEVYNRALI